MLGDEVEAALRMVGITPTLVTRVLGRECGCEERKTLLNSLDHWARRVIAGRVERAEEFLRKILG